MKIKKIFLLIILIFIGLSISSCEINIKTNNKDLDYKVTYILNNGEASYQVDSDESVDKPTSPEFEGYIFAGWYLDSNYTNKFDFNTKISKDIALYAKWLSVETGEVYDPLKPSIESYTVNYRYEDETIINTVTIKSTDILQKPSNPIKTGYTFKGWYLKNSTVEYVFNTIITSNLDIYAKFEKNPEPVITYTVNYRYEDESIINTITVKINDVLSKPENPTKAGYTFKGWYLKNSTVEYVFNTAITSNLDIYAKFEQQVTTEKLLLTFTDSYYDELNGYLDTDFKYKLHELIESTHTTKLTYSQVWNTLLQADADPNNPGSIICFYTGVSYSTRDNGSTSSGVWNREHVWPKSLGFSNQSHPAHNDCHHLHATEKWINAQRGNSFFGEVTSGSSDSYGNKWTSTLFEPRDEVKGDVARSIFYMVVRYENGDCSCDLDLELVTSNTPSSSNAKEMGNLLTLLKWHYQDPVSTEELNRNNIVYSIQGNKNPFIDHPEFVSYLYTSYVSSYTDISKIEYLIS